MRCEHCNQNEATTYIKQNINGKVTEMHLCRDCAEKLGVLEPCTAIWVLALCLRAVSSATS